MRGSPPKSNLYPDLDSSNDVQMDSESHNNKVEESKYSAQIFSGMNGGMNGMQAKPKQPVWEEPQYMKRDE